MADQRAREILASEIENIKREHDEIMDEMAGVLASACYNITREKRNSTAEIIERTFVWMKKYAAFMARRGMTRLFSTDLYLRDFLRFFCYFKPDRQLRGPRFFKRLTSDTERDFVKRKLEDSETNERVVMIQRAAVALHIFIFRQERSRQISQELSVMSSDQFQQELRGTLFSRILPWGIAVGTAGAAGVFAYNISYAVHMDGVLDQFIREIRNMIVEATQGQK
jgi:hypothetical protein